MEIQKSRGEEIVKLHGEIMGHLRQSLGKAIRIGELLTEQKESLKHGEFTPWLEANIPFTDRTARNYMRVYQERDKIKTESISDLTGAYKLLAAPAQDDAADWTPPDPDVWLELIHGLNNEFFRHKTKLQVSEDFNTPLYRMMQEHDDGTMTDRESRGFALWINHVSHLCYWSNTAHQKGLETLPRQMKNYLQVVYKDRPEWKDTPRKLCRDHCGCGF